MTEQLLEAAILLCVGMLVVFSFLSLLIGGINLITWYVSRYPGADHLHNIKQNNNNKQTSTESQNPLNNDVVAAISAAVKQYRQRAN